MSETNLKNIFVFFNMNRYLSILFLLVVPFISAAKYRFIKLKHPQQLGYFRTLDVVKLTPDYALFKAFAKIYSPENEEPSLQYSLVKYDFNNPEDQPTVIPDPHFPKKNNDNSDRKLPDFYRIDLLSNRLMLLSEKKGDSPVFEPTEYRVYDKDKETGKLLLFKLLNKKNYIRSMNMAREFQFFIYDENHKIREITRASNNLVDFVALENTNIHLYDRGFSSFVYDNTNKKILKFNFEKEKFESICGFPTFDKVECAFLRSDSNNNFIVLGSKVYIANKKKWVSLLKMLHTAPKELCYNFNPHENKFDALLRNNCYNLMKHSSAEYLDLATNMPVASFAKDLSSEFRLCYSKIKQNYLIQIFDNGDNIDHDEIIVGIYENDSPGL